MNYITYLLYPGDIIIKVRGSRPELIRGATRLGQKPDTIYIHRDMPCEFISIAHSVCAVNRGDGVMYYGKGIKRG